MITRVDCNTHPHPPTCLYVYIHWSEIFSTLDESSSPPHVTSTGRPRNGRKHLGGGRLYRAGGGHPAQDRLRLASLARPSPGLRVKSAGPTAAHSFVRRSPARHAGSFPPVLLNLPTLAADRSAGGASRDGHVEHPEDDTTPRWEGDAKQPGHGVRLAAPEGVFYLRTARYFRQDLARGITG